MTDPLMPKGTAIWLVENTALTFDQIADTQRCSDFEADRHDETDDQRDSRQNPLEFFADSTA